MMLGEELGLGHHPQNSQAYVTGWLRKLKGRSGCGTQGDGRRAANRRLADPQCDQGNRGAKRRLANRTPDDRPLPAAGRPPHLKAAQPRRSRSRWTTTTGSSSLSGPNSVETVCSTNAAETSAGSGNASDAPSSAQRRTATCCRAAPPRPGSDGPEPTPSPPSTTSHASRKRKECPSTPSSSRPPTPDPPPPAHPVNTLETVPTLRDPARGQHRPPRRHAPDRHGDPRLTLGRRTRRQPPRHPQPAGPPARRVWRLLTGLEQPWRSIEPLLRLYLRLTKE